MDFETAMEFSVVILSAEWNTQTMLRVVSLEEELLNVPEYQGVPMEVAAFEPAGPGSPPPAWPISGESVQASTTCRDRRRRSCCLRILACPFCVGSLKPAIIVETAVGPLLTTSRRCPGESRRGPWHRVS